MKVLLDIKDGDLKTLQELKDNPNITIVQIEDARFTYCLKQREFVQMINSAKTIKPKKPVMHYIPS